MARRSKRNPDPDDLYEDDRDSWPYHWTVGPIPPDFVGPGTNRRNPRKTRRSSAKQVAWREKFGQITRMAREIFKARGCDYGSAFREARAQIEGSRAAANPYFSPYEYITWDQSSPWSDSPEPFGANSWPPVSRRNGKKSRRR